jgi:hypothetical protein
MSAASIRQPGITADSCHRDRHGRGIDLVVLSNGQEDDVQAQIPHRKLRDPFAHYLRGELFFDGEKFTFTAHRVPYLKLDDKAWDSEPAFMADYREAVTRKYSV